MLYIKHAGSCSIKMLNVEQIVHNSTAILSIEHNASTINDTESK
jgi:hypothetical protein